MSENLSPSIDNFVLAVNLGIAGSYFLPASRNDPVKKDVIKEAKIDLDYLLQQAQEDSSPATQKSIKRLKLYSEIVDLLDSIPEEHWTNAGGMASALHDFCHSYSARFELIIEGNVTKMLPYKYQIIAEKAKLEPKAIIEGPNGSTAKLVRLADKYIELLKLDYANGQKLPSA